MTLRVERQADAFRLRQQGYGVGPVRKVPVDYAAAFARNSLLSPPHDARSRGKAQILELNSLSEMQAMLTVQDHPCRLRAILHYCAMRAESPTAALLDAFFCWKGGFCFSQSLQSRSKQQVSLSIVPRHHQGQEPHKKQCRTPTITPEVPSRPIPVQLMLVQDHRPRFVVAKVGCCGLEPIDCGR